jgi:hypothetical protein
MGSLDLLGIFLTKIIALTFIVWLCTEGVGTALRIPKLYTAMIFGPLLSGLAHGAGLLLGENEQNIFTWLFVIITGFITTLGAKTLNDKLVNPLKRKLSK